MGPALSWLIVLHVIIAGWCTLTYARSQGMGEWGALVAAIGYMFAGKWLLHLLAFGHYNMVPLAWLPLVPLWLEKGLRAWTDAQTEDTGPSARKTGLATSLVYATWAGAAFALLILAAYPYMTLYAGLFVAAWTLGVTLEQVGYLGGPAPRSWQRTRSGLGRWAALGAWTVAVAAALGAVQFLPGLDMARGSSRAAGVFSAKEVVVGGVHALAALVGPPLTTDFRWAAENRGGLGLLWLSLACLAPMVYRGQVRYQAGVCLALVIFAGGGAVAVHWLPGFRVFQLPSRMLMIAALPVALLAGRTVQALVSDARLIAEQWPQCRRLFLKISTWACCLLILLAMALRFRGDVLAWHPYWLSLLITLPVAWWLLGTPGWRWAASAWIVILLLDLWFLTWPLVDVRSEDTIYQPSECVSFLAEQRDRHGRVLDINAAGYSPNCTPLWPGMPIMWDIESVRGFNSLDVLRYREFLQFIVDRDEPLQPIDRMFTSPVLGTFPIHNQSLADLLGIRYLVQPSDVALAETILDLRGRSAWKKVYEDPAPRAYNFIPMQPTGADAGLQDKLPGYTVYENTGALPRAFIVPEARPLPERSELLATLRSTDFTRTVLLETDQFKRSAPPGAAHPHPARITAYRPNEIVVELDGTACGYLVLTDIYNPDWTAAVDGKSVDLYRANYLFRAIQLPAGARRVVFALEPHWYRWGKAISIGALLVVLLMTAAAAGSRVLRKNRDQKSCDSFSRDRQGALV
jgi:hypothetical protein